MTTDHGQVAELVHALAAASRWTLQHEQDARTSWLALVLRHPGYMTRLRQIVSDAQAAADGRHRQDG